jgi:N-acetylneuraminic acid mutarotase
MSNSFKSSTHLRTDSSNGTAVNAYTKPVHTTGENLGPLVGASLTTVDDDYIYVFGGFDQYSDDLFNKLYKLDYKNQCHWSQVIHTKGKPPGKRTDHSAILWQTNKLVIFGGSSEEEEDVYFNDISVLDLATMTWQQPETAGFVPQGRIRHSATIDNDKLYIAGGLVHSANHNDFADTLLILDLKTWEWQAPMPFVCRAQHMSFVYNNRLYLFSGLREDMSRSNDFALIDLMNGEVSQLEIVSPSSPSLSGQRFAQVCGDQLIVLVTYPFREAAPDESPVTGLWSLHLSSMQWRYREIGTRYEGFNWHSFTMTENSSCFYLCGTTEEEPDEYYSMVLRVEVEELGIVPVPPSQLGHDLIRLLQSTQHTDFTITSTTDPDAPPIAVHRLVLLARWPHFVQLMENGKTLSNTLQLPEPTHILAGFVRFLYTDTINDPFFTTDLVADLLVLAQLYILPRLTALCVTRLYSEMTIENASKTYHHAAIAEQRGLKQASLFYIFQHFGAISHTQGFRRLPRPILFQIWDDMPKNATIVGQDSANNNSTYCSANNSDMEDEDME